MKLMSQHYYVLSIYQLFLFVKIICEQLIPPSTMYDFQIGRNRLLRGDVEGNSGEDFLGKNFINGYFIFLRDGEISSPLSSCDEWLRKWNTSYVGDVGWDISNSTIAEIFVQPTMDGRNQNYVLPLLFLFFQRMYCLFLVLRLLPFSMDIYKYLVKKLSCTPSVL